MAHDGLRGRGMLITLTEVRAKDEVDYNEWYNRQHIDERVDMPGFRRARRYVATKGDPKYLATYECAKVGDLADPRYLAQLANQSPWSQRVMKRFTKFHRLTLKIRVDLAHGIGGAVTCLRFVPEPKQAGKLARWLKETALPAAVRMPGMVGACVGENDLDVANAPARAQGQPATVRNVEWVILLEGADAAVTAGAQRAHLPAKAFAPFGLQAAPIIGTYRLLFGNDR
jgi:hypothetical protein